VCVGLLVRTHTRLLTSEDIPFRTYDPQREDYENEIDEAYAYGEYEEDASDEDYEEDDDFELDDEDEGGYLTLLEKQDLLKIDKDCIVPRKWLLEWVQRIVLPTFLFYRTTVVWVKSCPSERKGLHFYIKIDRPTSPLLVLELQFLLGDDAQRVSMNRARMRAGFEDWNKLFENEHTRLKTLYRSPEFSQV
jgi:hypothetical protein